MTAEAFAPSDDLLADDGYPSDAELDTIRHWPISGTADMLALLRYVEPRWRYAESGYWRRHARRRRDWKGGNLQTTFEISTAGWSGNEDIIRALRDNLMFWGLCWESHRRGGHYVFRVPELK